MQLDCKNTQLSIGHLLRLVYKLSYFSLLKLAQFKQDCSNFYCSVLNDYNIMPSDQTVRQSHRVSFDLERQSVGLGSAQCLSTLQLFVHSQLAVLAFVIVEIHHVDSQVYIQQQIEVTMTSFLLSVHIQTQKSNRSTTLEQEIN